VCVCVCAGEVGPLHPLFPYMQYYDLANYSVDTFVKIR